MKYSKVLILILLPLALDTIISCCDCTDLPYTNYPQGVLYSHTGILASAVDNSGPQAKAVTTDTVPASAFGIRVIVDRQEVQRMARRSGLIQSAYAFECDFQYSMFRSNFSYTKESHDLLTNDKQVEIIGYEKFIHSVSLGAGIVFELNYKTVPE
jgi:hypothetical protein